jgi:hypothetical protein
MTDENTADAAPTGDEGIFSHMASADQSYTDASASPNDAQAGSDQSTSVGTSDEDSKQEGANQPPPAEGQQNAEGETSEASKDEGTQDAPSEEDTEKAILDGLGLKAKEPETLETLRTQLAASSRESIKNAQTIKGLEATLSSQGLKTMMTTGEDGKPKMVLVATPEYVTQKLTDADVGERTITSTEAAEAVEDPQAFAQKMFLEGTRHGIEAATKSPVPTADENSVVIPNELLQLYTEEVKAEVNAKGEPVHPDYDALEPYITQIVAQLPQAVANVMSRNVEAYKAVMSLAYGKVAHVAAPVLARRMDAQERAKERTEKAKTDVSVTNGGQGAGRKAAGGNGDAGVDGANPEALAIMNATIQH